jgi:hypothetical protein
MNTKKKTSRDEEPLATALKALSDSEMREVVAGSKSKSGGSSGRVFLRFDFALVSVGPLA